MANATSSSSLQKLALIFWPLTLGVFVATTGVMLFQAVYEPVNAVLADAISDQATPLTAVSCSWIWNSIAVVLFATAAIFFATFMRNVMRSNRAVEVCRRNGTVTLIPDHSFAITRYLYSKVRVDLSRTNFDGRKPGDFPFESIHRLSELQIRETEIPDWLAEKIMACTGIDRLDLSDSKMADSRDDE